MTLLLVAKYVVVVRLYKIESKNHSIQCESMLSNCYRELLSLIIN